MSHPVAAAGNAIIDQAAHAASFVKEHAYNLSTWTITHLNTAKDFALDALLKIIACIKPLLASMAKVSTDAFAKAKGLFVSSSSAGPMAVVVGAGVLFAAAIAYLQRQEASQ